MTVRLEIQIRPAFGRAAVQADGESTELGVNVYSYWMADTIEVKIHEILQEKGLLFEDVIEAMSEDDVSELISTEEWLDMFGIKGKGTSTSTEPPGESVAQLMLGEIRAKLYEVSPARFEHIVKSLLQSFGYPNLRVTGRSHDGGIDVLSTRNTSQGVCRAVAQCKRHRSPVGVNVACELLGVLAADPTKEKAYLVTTGEFSAECLRFCQPLNQIELVSGERMAIYVKQFGLEI